MIKGFVFAGELNRRVSFYETTTTKNSQAEVVETPALIGKFSVKRIDAVGSEEEDGRLIGLGVCRYQMRYNNTIFLKASTLYITDDDGDWDVVSPGIKMEGRNRYMELKCRKRG